MSRALFSRNPDLQRLRDDGYFVEIRGGLLVMREVPYVDASRALRRGTLLSSLTLAGDRTQTPDNHVAYFDGEFPCQADGTAITQIAHGSGQFDFGNGATARHSFSSKPEGGYIDYYHKMTTYLAILSGPAAVVEPGSTARVFRTPEDEEKSVFRFTETASDRVGIGGLSDLLAVEVVAIIGLGGTGSYILDLVAKTPAREIHLFDGDVFLQHNAFRAPGTPTIEVLRDAPKKVDYFAQMYAPMRTGIVPHDSFLDAANVSALDCVSFAFVSMDASPAKRAVIERLERNGVSFIDVGMGLELDEGSLGGILRVTASTPEHRDHVRRHVALADAAAGDIYASNIQVADLNALNAVLAVIKWKKLRGFYRDLEGEHHMTYTTDGNLLLSSEG
ncbi:ThiF family adenylyltransferase [Sphingomonas sp. PB4P5]|uniref:ThiF family adenylyltransferase n=1 Tax=Parasphingomonas puruogangriensis TaxID=3096155 RepID=UPI002FC81A96